MKTGSPEQRGKWTDPLGFPGSQEPAAPDSCAGLRVGTHWVGARDEVFQTQLWQNTQRNYLQTEWFHLRTSTLQPGTQSLQSRILQRGLSGVAHLSAMPCMQMPGGNAYCNSLRCGVQRASLTGARKRAEGSDGEAEFAL